MAKFLRLPRPEEPDEDPLAGVANLFDVSVVFIVGLMISLFSVYRMTDLLDPDTEVTMVKTTADGGREIIVKRGPTIEARRITDTKASGDGERLGVAYRLTSGEIIYVPEDSPAARGEGQP
jgi:hypothetical protein